ncbi:hypothetical protein KAR91_16720 [Candidatus Pacearchaeota archaeon]|nr:hypothetical protein [Candidatus Pacearchaeota archaeon]
MSETRPYTADIDLSRYNLNDLLPKIWRDGYQRRDKWFEFDVARRLIIEMFKVSHFPIKLFLIYYILTP